MLLTKLTILVLLYAFCSSNELYHTSFYFHLNLLYNRLASDSQGNWCGDGCHLVMRVCIGHVNQGYVDRNNDFGKFCSKSEVKTWDLILGPVNHQYGSEFFYSSYVVRFENRTIQTSSQHHVSNPLHYDSTYSGPVETSSYAVMIEVDHNHSYTDNNNTKYERIPVDRFAQEFGFLEYEPHGQPRRIVIEGKEITTSHFAFATSNALLVGTVRVGCSAMYYGCRCQKYCSHTERYSCSPKSGLKICTSGWYGDNCDIKCEEKNIGSHCFSNGTFTCIKGFNLKDAKEFKCNPVKCAEKGHEECQKSGKACKDLDKYSGKTHAYYQCV